MLENVSAFYLGVALAALISVTTLFALYYRHLVHHRCGTSLCQFAWCVFCTVTAYILRRGNGRHRMKDLYHLQRYIRADWRQLTPNSLGC